MHFICNFDLIIKAFLTQLVDTCTRLLLAFITIWKSALANNPAPLKTHTVTAKDSGVAQPSQQHQQQQQLIQPPSTPQTKSSVNSNSSGTSSITSSGTSSITQNTAVAADATKKNEQPLATTMHLVEGLGLVMLCNCRSYPRKLAVMILKEIKNLIKALGLPETEPPLIDVIDRCCPKVFLHSKKLNFCPNFNINLGS